MKTTEIPLEQILNWIALQEKSDDVNKVFQACVRKLDALTYLEKVLGIKLKS